MKGLYGRRPDPGGALWAPHHQQARRGGDPHHQVVWGLHSPLRLSFGIRVRDGNIWQWIFVRCNSENIFCVGFLKRKTAENRKLALGILLIG